MCTPEVEGQGVQNLLPAFSWSPFFLSSTSLPFQCRFLKPDHFPRLRAVSWAARGLEGGGGGEQYPHARVHACGRGMVAIAPRPGQIPTQTLKKAQEPES